MKRLSRPSLNLLNADFGLSPNTLAFAALVIVLLERALALAGAITPNDAGGSERAKFTAFAVACVASFSFAMLAGYLRELFVFIFDLIADAFPELGSRNRAGRRTLLIAPLWAVFLIDLISKQLRSFVPEPAVATFVLFTGLCAITYLMLLYVLPAAREALTTARRHYRLSAFVGAVSVGAIFVFVDSVLDRDAHVARWTLSLIALMGVEWTFACLFRVDAEDRPRSPFDFRLREARAIAIAAIVAVIAGESLNAVEGAKRELIEASSTGLKLSQVGDTARVPGWHTPVREIGKRRLAR